MMLSRVSSAQWWAHAPKCRAPSRAQAGAAGAAVLRGDTDARTLRHAVLQCVLSCQHVPKALGGRFLHALFAHFSLHFAQAPGGS